MSHEIKIIIKLGDGRDVTMTVDEAKDLHTALGSLVGAKTVHIPPVVPCVPNPWPYRGPYWYTSVDGSYGTLLCSSVSGA